MRLRLSFWALSLFVALGGCILAAPPAGAAEEIDRLKVGVQPDGRIVVPTNQILKPAGKQILFPGRPVAVLLLDSGKTLAVQNKNSLLFLDPATGAVKQTLASKVGLSVVGLAA